MNHLRAMVGFRNILVHQYQMLDLDIMVEVVERRLDDLLAFANIALPASDWTMALHRGLFAPHRPRSEAALVAGGRGGPWVA